MLYFFQGEMAERSKAHAWKACVVEISPRVRIPLSPPKVASLAIRSGEDREFSDPGAQENFQEKRSEISVKRFS